VSAMGYSIIAVDKQNFSDLVDSLTLDRALELGSVEQLTDYGFFTFSVSEADDSITFLLSTLDRVEDLS